MSLASSMPVLLQHALSLPRLSTRPAARAICLTEQECKRRGVVLVQAAACTPACLSLQEHMLAGSQRSACACLQGPFQRMSRNPEGVVSFDREQPAFNLQEFEPLPVRSLPQGRTRAACPPATAARSPPTTACQPDTLLGSI